MTKYLVKFSKKHEIRLKETYEYPDKQNKIAYKILVDMGYRKYNHTEDAKAQAAHRLLKRRSCIETITGHTKQDNRTDRNYLKDKEEDGTSAILAACGYNLRQVMAFLLFFLKKIMVKTGDMLVNFLNEVFPNEKRTEIYT